MARPAPIRDGLKANRRRRRARRREHQDKSFTAWLHDQPCAVPACRTQPVEQHHEPPRSNRKEWHDRKSVALCELHHAHRHRVTRDPEAFERRWGMKFAAEIARLNAEFEAR